MKRCPVCEKTFDDNMRFCQSDGTPLIEDAAPVDPYKTMVARPNEIAAAIPPAFSEPSKPEAPIEQPSKDEGEVLQLPKESDPLKTMYASEDEIRKEMAMHDSADNEVIEIPPLSAPPEPPRFSEPSVSPPPFGDVSPPPSPFSPQSDPPPAAETPFSRTSPPIPSPFSDPKPSTYRPPPAETPRYAAPEPPPAAEPEFNPFKSPLNAPVAKQSMAQAEWTPPPAPESGWQNQPIGQNTPSQPPPAGSGKLNQTLPIVSLVFGILSLCCYVSPITGLIALVTGFLGIKNVKSDPNQYGGKTLAIIGMIAGGLFFLIGIAYWVFILFFGGMAMIMDAAR